MKISGVVPFGGAKVERKLDFYVPVTYSVNRYYSYDMDPWRIAEVGPGGELDVELRFPADTGEITEIVLLMLPESGTSLSTDGCEIVEGSPCLDIPQAAFRKAGRFMIATFDLPTSLGFGNDSMDLILGCETHADRIIRSGKTDFLINADSLVGVRFLGLTSEDLDLMRECQISHRSIRDDTT